MKNSNDYTIETALNRLEEIVALMEHDLDNLETAVNLFEEGSQLVRFCTGKLKEVENKIETLTKENGEQGE